MPRRSRGCQACRQRRIGCDGALPSCRQCLITNRSCSGPVQGTIIIDQTDSVALRYRRARLEPHRAPAPITQQPSSRAIFSQAFIAQFLAFMTSIPEMPHKPTWLRQFGDIPTDEKGSPLDLALQAVATAYCGVVAKNHSAVMEACRMYGDALYRHSKAISRGSGPSDAVTIYTSVVLSLFEAVWPTNMGSYAIHLNAARKMLAAVDYTLGQNELLREVAVHVQYQTVRRSISIYTQRGQS